MTTVQTQRPRRQCKPLLPVQVRAALDLASPDELAHGTAILAITTGDDTDSDTRRYWTRFLFDRGEAYAVALREFATDTVYQVTLADEQCSCPDHTYRPNRPGGCRHIQALRQALPSVALSGQAVTL